MFGLFSNWSLSRAISKQLSSLLDKQAKKLLPNLKDVQSATLNGACDVIADSTNFRNAGIPAESTTDRISKLGDSTQAVELQTAPLDTLRTSPVFAAALATKLKSNTPLKVAANELRVNLDDLLSANCPAYIKHAMPNIIQCLIKERTKLYAGYVVIAFAEGEAYELGKVRKDATCLSSLAPLVVIQNRPSSLRPSCGTSVPRPGTSTSETSMVNSRRDEAHARSWATPNPSIERTGTGKPVSAAHVKRWADSEFHP